MSEFSDDWLALREPADAAARADGLLEQLSGLAPGDALSVLDLGCGSGANLRHLAPRLAATGYPRQRWTCVDHEPLLLEQLPLRVSRWAALQGIGLARSDDALRLNAPGWSCDLAVERRDLVSDLKQLALPRRGLVTASALLDLVSADWLDGLLGRCKEAGCALLFVLTYNGRLELRPAHEYDATVMALVNRHQLTDKGFGPALGPGASLMLAERCGALGYQVHSATSDWDIGPDAPQLQAELIRGWHDAALALTDFEPGRSAIRAWQSARLAAVDSGRSFLRVGHLDLLALPGDACA